ncbi:lipase family protein, partial [Vibrio cholerae HC-50A2]
KSLC